MALEDFKGYIQARLLIMGPNADIADGGGLDLVDAGDALTDLAVKPVSYILDPLVEESTRIKNSLSFRFPDLMTRESAANLGANFFAEMNDGTFTRGT